MSVIISRTSSNIRKRASGGRPPMPSDRTKRRGQLAVLWAMSASIIAILMSSLAEQPFLIYNASGSAPLGFYYLERRMPSRGELAVFKPPPDVELLIMAHGFLPIP